MPPSFKLKFLDRDDASFILRIFLNKDKQLLNATGVWFLVAGKIKLAQGNWQSTNEGYVWFYDKDHILNSQQVKLSARDVITGRGALRAEGTAYLRPEWALGHKAGGTNAGGLRWKLVG